MTSILIYVVIIVSIIGAFNFGIAVGATRATYSKSPQKLLKAIKRTMYMADLKGETLASLSIEDLAKKIDENLTIILTPDEKVDY